MEEVVLPKSDPDWTSFDPEIKRLEDVIKKALLENYDIERANNAFHRFSIYQIAGNLRLTHRDRMIFTWAFWRYRQYLVFELRTPAPVAKKDDVAHILIKCDNQLTLRITFKEE